MARLDAISEAQRPKMHGRAMLSGPSGAGKTWTALSMATALCRLEGGEPLLIDTERESALTYADVFRFDHLPWRPPYDPTELADTLAQLTDYPAVIVDSFTHFWRGRGGTLDIADGKFGGWKNARPVQERLVEAVLSVPAHVFLCVRSKMEYLVEGGTGGTKQTVTRVGMAPVQDDTLVYELNIALDLDLDHRLTVTKSRSAAVPVGRMYPAGTEKKAAEDYAEWLAGGVPPASREEVDSIVAAFSELTDEERRKKIKAEFVERFGMPHSLTASQVAAAKTWLDDKLSDATAPPAHPPTPEPASESAGSEREADPAPAGGSSSGDGAVLGEAAPPSPESLEERAARAAKRGTPVQADLLAGTS